MAGPSLFYDRVKETTTTSATGTLTLAGAVSGYQSFSVVGNGNSCYYFIADQTGANWESGIGTYTSSGTTLSRDTVISSSNSGALVNFSAGTKDVFLFPPANVLVRTLFTGIASTTVGSTGTETTLIGTGIGSMTIPAKFITVGKTIRLKARGYLSTKASTAGTLNIKFKIAGSSVLSTGAFTVVDNLTNTAFDLEVEMTCRTSGSSGTLFLQGSFKYEVASVGTNTAGMVNTSTTAIDTTASKAIDVSATWGTSDASNTITLTNVSLEPLN